MGPLHGLMGSTRPLLSYHVACAHCISTLLSCVSAAACHRLKKLTESLFPQQVAQRRKELAEKVARTAPRPSETLVNVHQYINFPT